MRRVGIEGKKLHTTNIELRFAPSSPSQKHARVAIVVPRHGHAVVERNRLRRVLREHVRLAMLNDMPAMDFVVRAQPGAYGTNAVQLRSELTTLSERLAKVTG